MIVRMVLTGAGLIGADHVRIVAADWQPRYRAAYRRQDMACPSFVNTDVFPETGPDSWDRYCAGAAAEAGARALKDERKVTIEFKERPAF